MTSGNWVQDSTKMANQAYPQPPALIGSYAMKGWTGADRPKRTDVLSRKTGLPAGMTLKQYRALSVEDQIRLRDWISAHPPKRSRSEEHPYTMEAYHDFRELMHLEVWANWPALPKQMQTVDPITAHSWGLVPSGGALVWNANHELWLLGKLKERILGDSFDLGVFLAEGNQALRMIANSATRINKAIGLARKGKWHAASVALSGIARTRENWKKGMGRNAFSQNWLELQYGWLPLLGDAYSGAQCLAHILNYPLQKAYRARRRIGTSYNLAPGTKAETNYVTYSVQIKALIKEEDIPTLGLLVDPLTIAWEKTPWSFVVDWFIPIGTYLSARGMASELKGTFVRSVLERRRWSGLGGDGVRYIFTTDAFYDFTRLTRTVSTSLDVPMPEVKPLAKVASWRHCANALALLTQRVRPQAAHFYNNH